MDMCSNAFVKHLAQSLQEGKVSEEEINIACHRILEAKYKLGLFIDPYRYCNTKRSKSEIYTAENRQVARDVAAKTFVLLKNEGNILPLKKEGKIALIGPLADTRNNIAGTWSVAQVPSKYTTIKEAMEHALAGKATLLYAQGSNIWRNQELQKNGESGKPINWGNEAEMKAEALKIAKEADVIVCAMGESAEMSGECGSRTNLEMPDVQRELLAELLKTGKPVVLLNFAGRPTVLTWEKAHVPAIMNVWFGGSEMGDALCDVIFGDKSPSGKLTTSMPKTTGQEPLYYNHQNTGNPVADDNEKFAKFASNCLDVSNGPLYPFGYGLSYTNFSYSNFRLSSQEAGISNEEATEWQDGKKITASVTVKNSGSRDADEIVQLYVAKPDAKIFRPAQELKGFAKVWLEAGESKTVTIPLDDKAFRYWNIATDGWEVEGGKYLIRVGASSDDICLTGEVTVPGTGAPNPYQSVELPHYLTGEVTQVSDEEFAALLGRPIPEDKIKIDRNMTLGELGHGRSPLGWIVAAVLGQLLRRSIQRGKPDLNILFQYNMPLRALAKMTNGAISMGMVDGIVMEAQGFWIIGLLRVIVEAVKNIVLNAQMENRLKNS